MWHAGSPGKAFCVFAGALGKNQLDCRPGAKFSFCLAEKDLKNAERSQGGIWFAKEGDDKHAFSSKYMSASPSPRDQHMKTGFACALW